METDFWIAIGSLSLAFILYTWLTITNLKNIIATKEERLKARREQRKRRKRLFIIP